MYNILFNDSSLFTFLIMLREKYDLRFSGRRKT